MENKTISIEDFNLTKRKQGIRNIPQQGNLDTDYSELLNYVGWTLESNHNNNSENLKEALKTLFEKYKISATTEFLRNQMRYSFPNKSNRIGFLLREISMTTIPILRFSQSNKPNAKIYSDKVNLIVDKQQLRNNRIEMKKRFNANRTYSNFNLDDIDNPVKEEKPAEYPGIEVRCQRCEGTIKFPLLPNCDTNKEEHMIAGIYSCLMDSLEKGNVVCSKCQLELEKEGLWKSDDITDWISQIPSGMVSQFTAEDFCNDFRNDKNIVSGNTIKNKIQNLANVNCSISKDIISVWK